MLGTFVLRANDAPVNAVRTVVALTEPEVADFLPEPAWSEFKALLPGAALTSSSFEQAGDWLRLLREFSPEILLTGWKTPPLPSDLPVGEPGALRYVCHLPGSVRKLVPRALIERGLLVTNWGNSISRTIAECALMLTLMALRRATHWALAMHQGDAWKDAATYTHSLFERRVGLHGFGAIAQCLVPLLQPFGCRMRAYSPSVPDALLARHGVDRASSLDSLFRDSDVVIEMAAATPGNHHAVNEAMLRLLPHDGVFVNVGRGSVVDEQALARVAAEGRIHVALDVFETEPLPADSPLRSLPNVTLLPHLAGPTRDRRRDSGALAIRNLRAYLNGEPLESLISLEIYDRST